VITTTVCLVEATHIAELAFSCVEVGTQTSSNGRLLGGGPAASRACSVKLIRETIGLATVSAAIFVVGVFFGESGDTEYSGRRNCSDTQTVCFMMTLVHVQVTHMWK
jgi:hypothetical protein